MNIHPQCIEQKTKTFYIILLYLISLLIFQFFSYRGIPVFILKMSGFIAPLLLFLITFNTVWYRSYKYNTIQFWIKCILLSTFVSFITAALFWGQGVLSTYRASIIFIDLLFFFFLIQTHFSKNDMLKFVLIFSFANIILWVYAASKAPEVVFGFLGSDSDFELVNNRGFFRISIAGRNLSIIAMFYFFCMAIRQKGKNTLNILLTIIFFLYNCVELTRFKIAIMSIIIFYYIYINSKKNIYILFTSVFVLVILFLGVLYFFGNIFDTLVALTQSQFSNSHVANDDGLIRIKEYAYFFTGFPQNLFTIFFGNGMSNHSELQSFIDSIKYTKEYYMEDVSYSMIYISLGLFGLISYIGLFIKVLKQKTSDEFVFAKIYIVYAILSTVTIDTVLDSLTLSVALYFLYLDSHSLIKNDII